MPRQRPAQQRVGAELFGNHRRVGAEIEHAAHTFDDEQQGARAGETDLERQGRAGLGAGHVDDAVRAVDRDRPAITPRVDELDAGRRPRAQEREHRRPVIGWTVGEAEAIALRIGDDANARQPPQLGRRTRVGAPHLAVEAPDAAEARRVRHLAEGQGRLVEELLGEMEAPRVRDVDRRRAQMLEEEAPQMAGGHAGTRGQRVDARLVERSFADQPQRARDDRRRAEPRRRPGRGFGTAAQTGAVARRLGGSGGRKIADVIVFRRAHRAHRPAIDPRRRDGDEEAAVEARVMGTPRAIAGLASELQGDGSIP